MSLVRTIPSLTGWHAMTSLCALSWPFDLGVRAEHLGPSPKKGRVRFQTRPLRKIKVTLTARL